MELATVFLIGTVVVVGFVATTAAWRNRRQRALRREMKRHLQRMATLGPYDPAN